MTTICIASGKGGAGKTSFAAALASSLGQKCIFADCDVDAANGALALGSINTKKQPYFSGPGFFINESACTGCGLCEKACRFNAIFKESGSHSFRITQELCERCGACAYVCKFNAVQLIEQQAGWLMESQTLRGFPMIHAELEPGEDTSGKLVALVRHKAREMARDDRLIVVDAPAGIGCPVIASLTGADLLIVIVEAGLSGIRDAERLIELGKDMKRPMTGIVNKAGLDSDIDTQARNLLKKNSIEFLAQIRFDPSLRAVEEAGKTWAELEGQTGDEIRAVLQAVKARIFKPETHGSEHENSNTKR
ncbi:ATP-binding protein [Spirochaetota bacterium]